MNYDVCLEIGRVIINDALVREVNFLFSRKVLDSLKRFDVKGKGVVGRPPYPNSLIILPSSFNTLILYSTLNYHTVRQTEGLARMLSIWSIDVPDHSTLNRRIRKLTIPVDIDASSNNIISTYKILNTTGSKDQFCNEAQINNNIIEYFDILMTKKVLSILLY